MSNFLFLKFLNNLENFRNLQKVEMDLANRSQNQIETINEENNKRRLPRSQNDYIRYRSVIEHYDLERLQYTLYPFQNELVANANNGRNTIICAPTGSGKTIVATDIIATHFSKFQESGKIARVIF